MDLSTELSSCQLSQYVTIGKLAYRVAEKVSLFYFLKEGNRILEATFQAAYDKLAVDITDAPSIFSSQESWEAFKAAHFSHLSPSAFEYLSPWLDQLDKLVAAIGEMAD